MFIKIFIISFIFLLHAVASANGLKCYFPINETALKEKHCEPSEQEGCVKIDCVTGTKVVSSRGCYRGNFCGSDMPKKACALIGASVKECNTCTGDLCNAGESPSPIFFGIGGLFLAGIMTMLQRQLHMNY